MKRLALLLVLVLHAFCGSQQIQGQNTLSFSGAILVGTTLDTVPANKVWKVESYMQANVSLTNQTNGEAAATLPGKVHSTSTNTCTTIRLGLATEYLLFTKEITFHFPFGCRRELR